MNLLPSQQATRIKQAIAQFEAEGYLRIQEPCDCGDHVRHNNGGNYHSIIHLRKDSGLTFVKWTDTCELKPPAEWEETGDPHKIIRDNADWL